MDSFCNCAKYSSARECPIHAQTELEAIMAQLRAALIAVRPWVNASTAPNSVLADLDRALAQKHVMAAAAHLPSICCREHAIQAANVTASSTKPHAPGFRYARWPVAFGFARHTALHTFDRHGWPEWGSERLSTVKTRLLLSNYGQTLHIGPLKVYLGRRRP
jgi:hypothetical protein